jgi:hypothetical protein
MVTAPDVPFHALLLTRGHQIPMERDSPSSRTSPLVFPLSLQVHRMQVLLLVLVLRRRTHNFVSL